MLSQTPKGLVHESTLCQKPRVKFPAANAPAFLPRFQKPVSEAHDAAHGAILITYTAPNTSSILPSRQIKSIILRPSMPL